MRRNKKQEEHVDESWLIPYADILTLLLALFIVLFASSQIDSKKYEQIANSFNSALQGGSGVLEEGTSVETYENQSPIPKIGEESPTVGGEEGEETEKGNLISPEQDQKQLEELQKNMNEYIKEKGLSDKVKTELSAQGLLLTIKDGVLFRSGSADVSGEARTIAEDLSDLLVADPPREIRIEGHTDTVPMKSAQFPSNWELSSARAINFMKVLLENDQLKPENFSAIGYGEYRPVSTNKTAEGRTQNRRVEVLVSPYQEQK